MLISPDFFNSNYIQDVEMKEAVERWERKEVELVPVIVHPCIFSQDPLISKLNWLPTNGKPIASSHWKFINEAYTDVTEGILSKITEVKAKKEAVVKYFEENKKKEAAAHLLEIEKQKKQQAQKELEERKSLEKQRQEFNKQNAEREKNEKKQQELLEKQERNKKIQSFLASCKSTLSKVNYKVILLAGVIVGGFYAYTEWSSSNDYSSPKTPITIDVSPQFIDSTQIKRDSLLKQKRVNDSINQLFEREDSLQKVKKRKDDADKLVQESQKEKKETIVKPVVSKIVSPVSIRRENIINQFLKSLELGKYYEIEGNLIEIASSYETKTEITKIRDECYEGAIFETVTDRWMVNPASIRLIKVSQTPCKRENVWFLVEVPAEYKTVTKQIVKIQGTGSRLIPAQYATITSKKDISLSTSPTAKLKLGSGSTVYWWSEFSCSSPSNNQHGVNFKKIGRLLDDKGYSVGDYDTNVNTMTLRMQSSLIKYQQDKKLPTGTLNAETLKSLGLSR